MNLLERYYYSQDGTKIFYRKDIPYKSKVIVIIAHGYMEHSGRYSDFGAFLVRQNIGVVMLDHRGNGLSGGEKGDIDDFFTFVEDFKELVALCQKEYPDKKLVSFGHSMGGLITFLYGLKYGTYLEGQIFSSPALGVPLGCKYLPPNVYELLADMKGLKFYRMGDELSVRNKTFLKEFREDPYSNPYATTRFMDQFLRIGVQYALANGKDYQHPSLFLLGEKDHVIPIERNQWMLSQITYEGKKVLTYPACMHDLLHEIEPDRSQIMEDILDWLKEFILIDTKQDVSNI